MAAMQSRIDDFNGAGVGDWNRRSQDVVEWARARAHQVDQGVADRADGPHEFVCPECSRHVTRSETSGLEYGHAKGDDRGSAERCPRRPDGVDPTSRGGQDAN